MGLVQTLQNANAAGGGHGIVFNPIVNKLRDIFAAKRVAAINQQGDQQRQQIVANAIAMRQRAIPKPVIAPTPVMPTPAPAPTPTTPDYYSKPQFQGSPHEVADLIIQAANKYGVDPLFAAAVAKHESAGTFSPTITNRGGDGGVGPFQITPGVGNKYVDSLTPAQRMDPKFSVDAGVRTLADAYSAGNKRFGGDPDPMRKFRDAYMIFNAGPSYTNSKTPLTELRARAQKVIDLYEGK